MSENWSIDVKNSHTSDVRKHALQWTYWVPRRRHKNRRWSFRAYSQLGVWMHVKKCTIQSHFGKCPTSEWLYLLNLTLKSLSTSISFQFINILRCTSCNFIRSEMWFPPPHGLKDPGFQTLPLGGSSTLTRWNADMAARTGCQPWLAHIAFESPNQNEV